jgi:hypothetical protein
VARVADLLDTPGDIDARHRFRVLAANGGITTFEVDKPGAEAAGRVTLFAALLDVERGDQTVDLGEGGRRGRSPARDVAVGGTSNSKIGASADGFTVDGVGDPGDVGDLAVDDRNGRNGRGGGGNESDDHEELEDGGHLGTDVEAHLDGGLGSRWLCSLVVCCFPWMEERGKDGGERKRMEDEDGEEWVLLLSI